MKPKRHIKRFYDLIHKLNMDGHINAPDKYAAIKDVELAVHKLRKAFEYSGEIETDKVDSDIPLLEKK